MPRVGGQIFKRLLLGRAMASGELEHTLLPKTIALPVFASDPLSSNAYATQEILLVLGAAGVGALTKVLPISIAVALLLVTVVTSYRQTVRAYPTGGGAYRVSKENIGMYAGLFAASALLLDYVLTVSVSITAGVDAIVSAAPALEHVKIQLAIGFILFVTLMNLRGVRESGTLFAIPTYGFVLSIFLLLITGFIRCLGGCPQAASSTLSLHGEAGTALSFLLILRAFSAGTTALTGVEAIADGVQAFRYPQSKNAAATLGVMGVLAISMFLGISALADATNVRYEEGAAMTVVAQIAQAIFDGGPLFYLVQIMTAAILILAANTAYQDFPRLSSILAQDRFMPRQFLNRGDRLVFSNGVLVLALVASLLIVVFDADLNKLIQLYLVGVFISFTLSQTGMVLRWRRLRDQGWQRRAAINAFGAFVTGVVLCVVVATKFLHGAWIVITAIPVVILLMRWVHAHYTAVAQQLAAADRRPVDKRPGHQHMVILATQVDAAFARAVGYARSVRPDTLEVLTLDPSIHVACKRLARNMDIRLLPSEGSLRTRLHEYCMEQRARLADDEFLTVMIPEVLRTGSLMEVVRRPGLHRLKGWLVTQPGIQVMDVPIVKDAIDPSLDQAIEPSRNYVIVLVSGVHNATLQAIEYAETLRPSDLRALSFGLDPTETEQLGNDWLASGIQHPLEIDDSPFREIGRSLINYVSDFDPNGLDPVVTIVLPEFVTKKRRHRILHGQTALVVKRHLLFQPGVITVSVPYRLDR